MGNDSKQYFGKEAIGEGSSSDELTRDKQDDHNDVEIVGGGKSLILKNDDSSNTDNPSKTKLITTDDTTQGLPPVIPDHHSIIWEFLQDVFMINNPIA